ncbi:MAG: MgtC/SapB family protein [Nitrospirae bacterium]|nr:MgtC/SapB family protein [Nitrospirota bacterium]
MITPYEIIIRLLLGALLGGIIGFERRTHGSPAGLRTQLLVCVACVLIMIISESYYTINLLYARVDPLRIAAGVMTGVGFLGGGVILKMGASIQGLTTAACIWIVAAIGIAIGAGQYIAGIAGFIITFFSLWVLRVVETRIPRTIYKYITLVTDESGDEKTIRSIFEDRGFKINKMDYEIEFPRKEKTYIFIIVTKEDISMKEIIEAVSNIRFVKRLEIKG